MNTLTNAIFGLATALGASGAAMLVNSNSGLVIVAYGSQTITGIVETVDLESDTFSVMTDDGTTHDLKVDDDTSYLLDGQASTAEEVLEEDAKVEATVDEQGLASLVSRSTQ